MTLLWVALVGYGILMYLVSPRAVDSKGFYWGYDAQGRETGFWLLTCSTFITWIFAKSVTNAVVVSLGNLLNDGTVLRFNSLSQAAHV